MTKTEKQGASGSRLKTEDLSLWDVLRSLTLVQWIAGGLAIASIFVSGAAVGEFWDKEMAHARQVRILEFKLQVAHLINGYWARDPVILQRLQERRDKKLPGDDKSVSELRDLLSKIKDELDSEATRDFARVWKMKSADGQSEHGEIILSKGLGPACVPSGLRPDNLNDTDISDDK